MANQSIFRYKLFRIMQGALLILFAVAQAGCQESAPKSREMETRPAQANQDTTAGKQAAGTLSNKAPEDTVAYRYWDYTYIDDKCDSTQQQECTRFHVRYPLFESTSPAIDSIYAQIDRFIELPSDYSSREEAVKQKAREFMQDYYDIMEEFPEHPSWLMEKLAVVVLNRRGLLSLKFVDYYFMGGAHPSRFITFYNYDLKRGRKLTLDDLFDAKQISSLQALAEKKFRFTWGIPDTASLNNYGFEFPQNRFALNRNFLLDGKGITFLYNSYEVAPYAMGITKFKVPYEELAPIIPKDSPISAMVSH